MQDKLEAVLGDDGDALDLDEVERFRVAVPVEVAKAEKLSPALRCCQPRPDCFNNRPSRRITAPCMSGAECYSASKISACCSAADLSVFVFERQIIEVGWPPAERPLLDWIRTAAVCAGRGGAIEWRQSRG